VRIQPVIVVPAADAVGPTKVSLLTAGSSKLPVVVVDRTGSEPRYFVFTVASLQAVLADQVSATRLAEALGLDTREPSAVLDKGAAPTGVAGTAVVDNGRLIGVLATDEPEHKEPSEQDMARGATALEDADSGRKRGLWQRLSRSNG
jgi:hypothetical protein